MASQVRLVRKDGREKSVSRICQPLASRRLHERRRKTFSMCHFLVDVDNSAKAKQSYSSPSSASAAALSIIGRCICVERAWAERQQGPGNPPEKYH